MSNAIVYMATNRVNGLRYIGSTGGTLLKRVHKHESESRVHSDACPLLCEALREHGTDAFDWSVLVGGLSLSDARSQEETAIVTHGTRLTGYNMHNGMCYPAAAAKTAAWLRGRPKSPAHRVALGMARIKCTVAQAANARMLMTLGAMGKDCAQWIGVGEMTVSNIRHGTEGWTARFVEFYS